jgi:hypothetical protein
VIEVDGLRVLAQGTGQPFTARDREAIATFARILRRAHQEEKDHEA